MTGRSRHFLIAAGLLLALIGLEQSGLIALSYTRTLSRSSESVVPNTLKGELVSALQVEKPILRWFPLVKYGETVQRYAYRNVHDNEPLYEHRVTTRTTVLALGFCSTARYDELARQPFEAFRAQLGHWVAARGH